ncbi:MAG: VacB/RNase II family 3'-5' exoribonuclease, partial [Nitrospinota bacterium]
MVTEKEILKFMREDATRPLKRKELAKAFNINSDDYRIFRHLVKDMIQEGTLIKIKGGRYGIPEKMNLVTGTLQNHPDGFGFVIPEKGHEGSETSTGDIYIGPRKMKDAMHGDKVVCRVESHGYKGKKEGRIIRIVERRYETLVGTYERSGSFGFVIPNERRITKDIYIPNKFTGKARRGQAVVVEITQYPGAGHNPEGKVIEVLGYPDNPEVEVEMIIRSHGLFNRFSEEALEETEKVPLKISDKELRERKDCRDLLTMTIDGENAKDFDDAISLEKPDGKNYRLYVHIADVSHYVTENSALDREAYKRGTSVYFLDRVIPMLPQKLSNEICSLKPKEDRLTVTVEMDIDPGGEILRYDIHNSVINSNDRMTYTDIAKILEDKDKKPAKRYDYLLEKFSLMKELCLILNKKREELGSIDFDLPEPDIILNQEGRIDNILKAERNIAHRIIEEFMLTANVVAANHIFKSGVPGIYRIHEEPDPEKISDFNKFIYNFGYSIDDPDNIKRPRGRNHNSAGKAELDGFRRKAAPRVEARDGRNQIELPLLRTNEKTSPKNKFLQSNSIKAKSLQKLLASARGAPEEKLMNHVLLRSMKQAVYSEKNSGHFCLGFKCYTHFTSPIRRYPDLITHRILKTLLVKKRPPQNKIEYLKKNLPAVAKHSSIRERIAMEAEREIIDLNKVHFMMDKIGEEFSGFITGVTSFGIFVELEDMFVEGLVHVTSIKDDYYIYHEKKHSIIGENKGKVYRIGDKVKVEIENVSMGKRQ